MMEHALLFAQLLLVPMNRITKRRTQISNKTVAIQFSLLLGVVRDEVEGSGSEALT
jgi:hypothetical protein